MDEFIAVALSGGVDSATAALLLKEQGKRVVGVFMHNWDEGECSATKDYQDALQVAQQIDIPLYLLDFRKEYRERVFEPFLQALREGTTPNPDVLCNKRIKFDALLRHVHDLGASFLATGHYCRLANDKTRLLRGYDHLKDQSYFLYSLPRDIFCHLVFPLGEMQKGEVKSIAKMRGLVNAEKPESMGICFIGKRSMREWLPQYLNTREGDIVSVDGGVVGRHGGVELYTIGQREGLGIGGRGAAWYVLGKDLEKNILYVGQGDHNLLYSRWLRAKDLHWIGKEPKVPYKLKAKIRHQQELEDCKILQIKGGVAHVEFDNAQRAVAIGQAIVFYEGEDCLGGGVICQAEGLQAVEEMVTVERLSKRRAREASFY